MPRGRKTSEALTSTKSNISGDKSFADDLNKERGIVSCRVALLLRSSEIKPLFYDLLQNHFSDRLVTGSLGWRVRFKDASACIDVGSWATLVDFLLTIITRT